MSRFIYIRSLAFVFGVALVLSACDAGGADDASERAEASTFSATISSSEEQRNISGDVFTSDDPDEFQGVFQSHPIRTDFGPFRATTFRLRAATGEAVELGQISPTRLESGTFGIETERNLEPPYGFVAAFRTADGEVLMATSGTVQIDLNDRRVAGTFELGFDEVDLVVSGTFTAIPRRYDDARCRRIAMELRALLISGEITEEEARRRLAAAGCDSDDRCRRLAAELRRLVVAGDITAEEARRRLAAAGCEVDGDVRCHHLAATLRRLVDAGEITEEEAQQRLQAAGCIDDGGDRP